MDIEFNIDPQTFQEHKRRRMSTMTTATALPKAAPTSAPGVHEIATFLPGRLEFEHELDNEAEDLIKDLEIGICLEYGGDEMKIDVNDSDVVARAKIEEEKRQALENPIKLNGVDAISVLTNGHTTPAPETKSEVRSEKGKTDGMEGSAEAETNAEEPVMPPPIETKKSLDFKLTLLEMYNQRVQKRHEAKALMFDRGLLDYKKVFTSVDSIGISLILFLTDAGSGEEKT